MKTKKVQSRVVSKFLNFVGAIALLWMLSVLIAPLVFNGSLYYIESPAPVVIDGNEAEITIHRASVLSVRGTSTLELHCNQIFYLPAIEGNIEPIEMSFVSYRQIPTAAIGTCRFYGIVYYQPVGVFGPELSHEWYTEEFVIEAE